METYLIHYGVKGMRWGVRKKRPSAGKRLAGGYVKAVNKHPAVAAAKKYKKKKEASYHKDSFGVLRTKDIRTWSDDDLNKIIARSELEKKLHDIRKQDISEGRKAAQDILVKSAGTIAAAAVTAYITSKMKG